MELKTKFNPKDHVWVVKENDVGAVVEIFDSTISSITYDGESIFYYMKDADGDYQEDDLVLFTDKRSLVDKIFAVMKNIRINEGTFIPEEFNNYEDIEFKDVIKVIGIK